MISETRSSLRYSPTGSRNRFKVTLKIASRSIVRDCFSGKGIYDSSTDGRLCLRLSGGLGYADGPTLGFLRLLVFATHKHFAPRTAFIRWWGHFGGGRLSHDWSRIQLFGHFAGDVLSRDQGTSFRHFGQIDGSLLRHDHRCRFRLYGSRDLRDFDYRLADRH